ncbi:MAG TPA: hypothetical protein VKZ98_11500 [Aquaticitalea sp.]|nr:hypothetical protein [Aquaticitalea sp.]
MSNFKADLNQEHLLSEFLDGIYFSKNLSFTRIHDRNQQYQGVDVVIEINNKEFFIDEKAQLHYLNHDLPTFTFELSYINKEGTINLGWLLDTTKKTDYYFLITDIRLGNGKQNLTEAKDIASVKITSVNRQKLIAHLDNIGLSKSRLIAYDLDLRTRKTFGKNPIPEFRNPKHGCLFFTQHLAEQPINLQLRLSYLLQKGVAKIFSK